MITIIIATAIGIVNPKMNPKFVSSSVSGGGVGSSGYGSNPFA